MNQPQGIATCLPKDLPIVSGVTSRTTDLSEWLSDLGLADRSVIGMNQTHSNHCTWVPSDQDPSRELPDTDACLSTEPHHVLKVRTADCLPILIYHPQPIIGVIHAGRRGTEAGILIETLTAIEEKIGGPIENLHLWFGPAICYSCYQIDEKTDLHYDLIKTNQRQLAEALPSSAYTVHLSERCTACENDLFYSYRKEGPKSGRIYSFISLAA